MAQLPFRDRAEAGRLLGDELVSKLGLGGAGAKAIVLGLPRGGLPVGAEVARALQAPLDIVLVRKLGVPWQPELAMGALAGDVRLLDERLIQSLGVSPEEVDAVVQREAKEMERRGALYRGGRAAPELCGRIVLLVDDGLATGSTMVAAVRCVRSLQPAKVVVAVPVGTSEACQRLSQEADECVCLELPEDFYAVGQWYEDFGQTTDAEVQAILREAHERAEAALKRERSR